MASSTPRWHTALRRAAYAPRSRTFRLHASHPRPLLVQHATKAAVQTRSFAVQSAANSLDHDISNQLSSRFQVTTPPISTHQLTETVTDAASSYSSALAAFDQLYNDPTSRLSEKLFVSIMEKANLESHFDAVRVHFDQYNDAVEQKRITSHRPRTTWPYYTSDELHMRRHVLWAMLHTSQTTRFRKMEAFYVHHVRNKDNRLHVYESDSLNFLLRMECTFRFANQVVHDYNGWFMRVHTILTEMRRLQYRTNYSSCHALFHFLMHWPDFAVAATAHIPTSHDHQGEERTEDKAIQNVLFHLMDTYPHALERDSRRLSLAVSTAAAAGRLPVAIALLNLADRRKVPIDAASFAHTIECAEDDDTRRQIADLYVRAQDHGWLYDGSDNHSMKNYLLFYSINDGKFAQIMELLREMEYYKVTASPQTVRALLSSFATYRAELRSAQAASRASSDRAVALDSCPTVLQLLTAFPTVLPRTTDVVSLAVLQGLRAGDIQEAVTVLRSTVRTTDVALRAEIFSQTIYALLASGCDVMAVREIETLFDRQHPHQRNHLYAQLLTLCESVNDVPTMVAVLDAWQDNLSQPLSRRAVVRVFDIVSANLKTVQTLDSDEVAETRYAVGGTPLSFLGLVDKYKTLFPLDSWTVSNTLVRSATSRLVEDVIVVLHIAQDKRLTLETGVYKAALDVLRKATTHSDSALANAAKTTLDETITTMKHNGAWGILEEKDPAFAQSFSG